MKGDKSYGMALNISRKMHEYPTNHNSKQKDKLYKVYLLLIKRSAYSGNTEAQYDLAQQYENISFLGIPNPKYNPKKCIYWYTKACKGKHAEAYNNLAALYEGGQGGKKNLRLALKLYKKSAELRSPNGKKNYKIMLRDMSKGGKYY